MMMMMMIDLTKGCESELAPRGWSSHRGVGRWHQQQGSTQLWQVRMPHTRDALSTVRRLLATAGAGATLRNGCIDGLLHDTLANVLLRDDDLLHKKSAPQCVVGACANTSDAGANCETGTLVLSTVVSEY